MSANSPSAYIITALLILSGSAPAASQTATIVGRVTSAETGSAVSGASVQAEAAGGVVAASTVTGVDGQFRLADLQPGMYAVVVSHLGYREIRSQDVQALAGQTVTVRLELMTAPIQLPDIAVTTGRPKNILESPGSEAVVSEERIAATVALVPTDFTPGVKAFDNARTGLFSATVVARGFSNVFSTALLSMTDNRYANVPSLRVNTAFLMPTTSEDIDRVEVLLGPGSALYGPNAANGVMHIITQSPFSHPGTTVSVAGGERDVFAAALRHAGVIGTRAGYKLTGQWMRGRDWQFRDQAELDARAADPALPARDLDLERWTGELRFDYRIADSADVILHVGRAVAENAIEMTPFGAAQARGWDYRYYQARFTARRLFLQGFLNTSAAGETFLLRTGEPIVDNSRLYAAQLRHSLPWGARQTFTYGVDVQRTDPRTGGTIHGRFEDEDESNEIGGYVHSETRLTRRLDLILAARYDYHSRFEDNVLSPRAGLVFHATPQHHVRATYNRAFSTPLNSQLFLDLHAGDVGALPFQVRAIGGAPGYRYRRDCGNGICIRSPFPAAGEPAPDPARLRVLDATQFWGAATNILFQASGGTVDIRAIPAPTSAQVGTVLRLLNPHPAGAFFETVAESSLTDIAPLAPTTSNTYEIGYKGMLAGGRVLVGLDVWHQRRENFVSAALVETPNVFLERATLAAYLANFMSPQQAGQVAAALAGIDGNAAVTGIPLGTAGFDHPFTSDQHVYLTYRNYGDVEVWGSDLGVEASLPHGLTLTGSYSWVNDNTFATVDAAGQNSDVLLNAPASKGSLGIRWLQPRGSGGLSFNSLVRFVEGFPMNSGVYVGQVKGYTVVDVGANWRVPRLPRTRLTVHAQNVLDNQHQQFVGAPRIGRLVTGRITYQFGGSRLPAF